MSNRVKKFKKSENTRLKSTRSKAGDFGADLIKQVAAIWRVDALPDSLASCCEDFSHAEEDTVRLKFLGTTSDTGNCPTAWETDRDTYLVQGARVTDPEALAALRAQGNGIPDHETVVEIPKDLARYLPGAQ
jgi:hypothetical protein